MAGRYETVQKPGLAGGRLFRRPSASGAQARSGTRATKSEGATASQTQRASGGAAPGELRRGLRPRARPRRLGGVVQRRAESTVLTSELVG